MFEITHVRFGHATNSSSTHSIVFIDSHRAGGDVPPLGGRHEYGWDCFTLTSDEAKADYVAAQFLKALRASIGTEYANLAIREVFGTNAPQLDGANDPCIDHQSVWDRPRFLGDSPIPLAFLAEVRDFVTRNDVAILGGNDNGGEHPLSSESEHFMAPWNKAGAIARQESDGSWTFYNGYTGTRIGFRATSADGTYPVTTKPSSPFLVDLKITDWCDIGCAFCYQNSTKAGKHADYYMIYGVLDALADAKVFEVAIGGGEPTSHERFADVLKEARRVGVTANFTTATTRWMAIPEIVHAVKDHAGAFAVSVNTVTEFRAALEAATNAGLRSQFRVQAVVGVSPEEELERLLTACSESYRAITLLGFKTNGRGAKYAPKKHHVDLIPLLGRVMKKRGHHKIGIDSALLREYGKTAFIRAGVPEQMLAVGEGESSCYIDAVEKTVAPSSWWGKPMAFSRYTFLEDFAKLLK